MDAKFPIGKSSTSSISWSGGPGAALEDTKAVCHATPSPERSTSESSSFAARRIATHRRRIVRILFVDDKESDVERCLRELKRMDFAVSADWVQVPAEFLERLRTQSYDAIVCDYSLPGWTGMEALELLHQVNQEIPFILATSTLDEDMTDAFMQKGAFDCIDKNRLNRLPLAVALAVEGRTWREERNHAEKEVAALGSPLSRSGGESRLWHLPL